MGSRAVRAAAEDLVPLVERYDERRGSKIVHALELTKNMGAKGGIIGKTFTLY
jgi:hypothetical protein